MEIVRLFDDLCCSVYTADNTVKALPSTEDSTITNHGYLIIVNRIRWVELPVVTRKWYWIKSYSHSVKVVLGEYSLGQVGIFCGFFWGGAQKIHECNTVDTTTADITLPGGLTKCVSISHSSSCFGLMVCG